MIFSSHRFGHLAKPADLILCVNFDNIRAQAQQNVTVVQVHEQFDNCGMWVA